MPGHVSKKVPVALRDWHMEVQKVKKEMPHLTHSQALVEASDRRKGVRKGKGVLGDVIRGVGAVAPLVGSLADAVAGARRRRK